MQFIQSFQLQRQLKNANFSVILMICLHHLHNVKSFTGLFVMTFVDTMEIRAKVLTVAYFQKKLAGSLIIPEMD